MTINLIWKRPDGFHEATPADFTIVKVGSHINLWVHNTDKDTFPFRIAGGWEEEAQSKRLNNLINLLNDGEDVWADYLSSLYHHSLKDEPSKFISELQKWLDDLKQLVKGGKWEVEIMRQSLDAVKAKIATAEQKFIIQIKG